MPRTRLKRKRERLIKQFYKYRTLKKVMSSPEELKETANQPDSRTIHLFYNLRQDVGFVHRKCEEHYDSQCEPREAYSFFVRHGVGIAWFSVSELGKKIFGGQV
jgi:hypothetical protein